MQTLPKKIGDFIIKESLFTRKDRLVLGVSGGLDSVVLLHILQELGYAVEIAHMNFGLRGEESNRDEAFVKQLANKYQLPFHLKRIEPGEFENAGVNIQATARNLRYNWFEELIHTDKIPRKGLPQSYTLTAHHADDQAETILQNLFRGSGINGLKGMQAVRDNIRRPLLGIQRTALEQYAGENNLKWVEDSSNLSDKYNRNKIRQRVLPVVKEIYPDVIQRMNENSRNLQSLVEFLNPELKRALKKLIMDRQGLQCLPINKWKQLEGKEFLLFEWLRSYGFSSDQTDQIISLTDSQTGHYVEGKGYRILKNRNWLMLCPAIDSENEWVIVEGEEGEIGFSSGRLSWQMVDWKDSKINPDPRVAVLDAKHLEFPLLFRKWKAGDSFYPLGMPKKKKITRFLTDLKVDRFEKEKIWVLETAKKISWVAGYRTDDRFKIKPSTKRAFIIEYKPD